MGPPHADTYCAKFYGVKAQVPAFPSILQWQRMELMVQMYLR